MSSALESVSSACILVYGSDQFLLGTRTMVLEQAGYKVFAVLEAPELDRIVNSQNISLLVLCHTLSPQKCEAALAFAQNRHPVLRTLLLTAVTCFSCSEWPPDAVLSAFDGPRKLVATVQDLLQAVPVAP